MSDIFAENDFDGGQESAPSVEPQVTDSGTTDSVDIPTPNNPTDQGDATLDRGIDGADLEGQASSGAQAGGDQPVDDLEKLEQEAEAALNDERAPKWFKNAVEKVYKPKVADALKKAEAYEPFGAVEDIQKAVSLREALSEVKSDPTTGMPVRTTENFVKSIYEEDPASAYQLISDLSVLPSPYTPGFTVAQELLKQVGVDPQRLPDIQKFAQNGYSLTAGSYEAPDEMELAQIPYEYHATFSKLDPDTRASLMADSEYVRNNNLKAHQIRIAQEEGEASSKEQREAQEKQQAEQQQTAFRQNVEAKGLENFTQTSESVMNSFVESLTKQAGLPHLDAMMVANTVVNALEPTLAGKMSLEALKKEGIEIDSQAPQIINKLEELSRHAAYYQLVNDTASLQSVVSQIQENQEKLIAKSNKIVFALAQKRNGTRLQPGQQQGKAVLATQNSRHAIAGTNSMNGGSQLSPQKMDFSEGSYEADIANDPFFKR
jgi:hypothetical protein